MVDYPKTNVYHEKDSADGFAFLGLANFYSGKNYSQEAIEIINRKYTLNAENKFKISGKTLSKEANYIYTLWACFKFFSIINDQTNVAEIMERVALIGCYPQNCLMRYSDEECRIVVPNATTACIEILSELDPTGTPIKKMIEALSLAQRDDGNFNYYLLDENAENIEREFRVEDCYHIAMMVFQLKNSLSYLSGDLQKKAEQIIDKLKVAYHNGCPLCGGKKFCHGSIGWGAPMSLLAGLKIDESKQIAEFELKNNSNFRVRSMCAYALKYHEILNEKA